MKSCLIVLLSLLLAGSGLAYAQDTQEVREVTLQQAVELALKNNLDIQIEEFNPEIVETSTTFEESRFEPLLNGFVDYNSATFPTGSSLQGDSVDENAFQYDATWRQRLYTGTLYEVAFRNVRTDTSQLFTSINPQFRSTLFATVTQPLMRNFGIEITKTPLKIAKQNRLTSNFQLQQTVMDIALQVEQLYWDLTFFRDQINVNQQSLSRARELYDNNRKQVEVGTMAPLEVVAAEAEVASREEAIITTERLIANTEDRLKTLVLGSDVQKSWTINVVPTDKPALVSLEMTEQEAIERGLRDNPDLKVLVSDLQTQTLNTNLASNALKPQVDLNAGYGLTGLGGDLLETDDNFPPNIIGIIPGGYGDALSSLPDNPTWSVGVTIGIPIGNKEAKANFVRADLQRKQAERILENARQNLTLNIRTAMRNMENDLKRLEATRASRVLQEKKLDAEKKKLEVGLSTNYVVLQYQDDLQQAQSRELLAITDYSKNRAQLKRYLGLENYYK